MSDAERMLAWLQEAGKHWDTVRPEDVARELGREPGAETMSDNTGQVAAELKLGEAQKRIAELEAQLVEKDAQLAAMRKALDQWGHDRDCARYPRHDGDCARYARHDQPCDCNIKDALSTDAGKAMLVRLRKLEAKLRRSEAELRDSEEFDEDWEEAKAKARAQAYEECAKVAEGDLPPLPWVETKPEHEANVARAIAAAIRAKAKEGM